MVSHAEFSRLLNELNFIPKVIELCHLSALQKFSYYQQNSAVEMFIADFEDDFCRRSVFLQKHLPDWVYNITNILALEARSAAHGGPISKSKARRLFEVEFVDREFGGPPLKDSRNEIWGAANLRMVLKEVLRQIKVVSAITLENAARRIIKNSGPMFQKSKAPLTGKHLQKLLKRHGINWKQMKAERVQLLIAEKTRCSMTRPGLTKPGLTKPRVLKGAYRNSESANA
jgi:hypothetical protein